jgi:hypothetical protein
MRKVVGKGPNSDLLIPAMARPFRAIFLTGCGKASRETMGICLSDGGEGKFHTEIGCRGGEPG